ncbi:hypothetical protein BC833DRAFT_595473 [Globomyces pollinis-pini]|nr:hypothetical protein BC833DRAFT_595473 [Globomyces pollinis-pini]
MILQQLNAPELEDLTIKFTTDYCLVMEEYLSNEEYNDIVNNLNNAISPFTASSKTLKFFKVLLSTTIILAFLLIFVSPFLIQDTPINWAVSVMFFIIFSIAFSNRCYIEHYKSNILKSGTEYCKQVSKKYESKEIKFVFRAAEIQETIKYDTRVLFVILNQLIFSIWIL